MDFFNRRNSMYFRNGVSRKRNLCQMQGRGFPGRVSTTRGQTPRFRYMYGDDGTTRFGGGRTYTYRRQPFTGPTFGGTCGPRTSSFFGPATCPSACAPSDKPEIGGAASLSPEKKASRDSRPSPDSEPECESPKSQTSGSTDIDPEILADPNTTIVEITDSEGESPETTDKVRASCQQQESGEQIQQTE